MTLRTVLAAAATMLLASHAEGAGFLTGNALWKSCRAADPAEVMFCAGYVAGMADALQCVPDGVHLQQVRDAVVKYLDEHPGERRLSASMLAGYAIWKGFCPLAR